MTTIDLHTELGTRNITSASYYLFFSYTSFRHIDLLHNTSPYAIIGVQRWAEATIKTSCLKLIFHPFCRASLKPIKYQRRERIREAA